MWAFGASALLLGGLLVWLGVRSHRRWVRWRRCARVKARVVNVEYQEKHCRENVIEDEQSYALITVRFDCDGRSWSRQKIFQGIVGTPVYGQTVSICFDRENGEWALRKQVRTSWGVLLVSGVVSLLITSALLVDGREIVAAVSDFQVESPNLPGSIFGLLVGIVLAGCTYACARGLLPPLLWGMVQPVWWAVCHARGRFEEIPARCEGMIRKGDDDDVREYPLFSIWDGGRSVRWYCQDSASTKHYQAGSQYKLYRDRRTGAYTLAPTSFQLVCIPLSLIPVGFCLAFTLSLGGCAAALLLGAVLGWFPW